VRDRAQSARQSVSLGDVATIVNGGTPKSNISEYWGGDVQWLTPKDMGRMDGREISETPRTITKEGLASSSARLVPTGSVILSTRAPIGHLAINRAPMAFNQGCRGIIPNRQLDPTYLFHFLDMSRDLLNDLGTGTTFKELSASNLKGVKIPLPPLEEQQRIVAVLDEAFEGLARARAHTEANLQNARELFEKIKSHALDYRGADRRKVLLSDVAGITSGLVDPREVAYADMPHIGAGNMITGSDELVDVMTAREEKLISGKYLFDANMVLYSKIRPYLQKAARPDFNGLCSADVYPVAPKQGMLDRDFLFHMLLGHSFTEYAISGSNRAGMPKVNRNHMFAFAFELPPLEAQRKIAAVIDEAHIACRKLNELTKIKLQDLDDLRQSLLQKAFAGELT
jgi:type I restriction enzyme, S subunit